ncbi:MAG: exodeoxyribonuclease V subunit alpha [Gammaproteobacteria bacterium]
MKLETTTIPAQLLAEGFSVHAKRWAQERGAREAARKLVQKAAYTVSLATTAGHVCAHLDDIAESLGEEHREVADLRRSLLDSGVVGTPEVPDTMPLILDAGDRLYLHRYFDYERRLARRLMRCGPAAMSGSAEPGVKARLDSLFSANEDNLGKGPDWQKIAAAMALLGTLTVISGGPGTGKTTTVVNLLACLLALDPGSRIALAAPTGRAAARMLEAVRRRAAQLPEGIRARLPTESFTIHRLLGVTPLARGFRHHADNVLAIDALVVDEASMLDLALATKLFEAVPEPARIILLGDKDQLAAVESGAVFSELSADPSLSDECRAKLSKLCGIPVICPPAPLAPTRLRDKVIWLSKNFRFASDSGIGRLAADINAGHPAPILARLRSSKDATLKWVEDGSEAPSQEAARSILAGYDRYLDTVRTDAGDQAAVTVAFGRFRTLCAVREGPRGVEAINRLVSRHFRRTLDHSLDPGERSEWYPGRPVMVLRNDYVLKLFNGDIGIVLPDETGKLMVCFPDRDAGFRAVAPVRLPEHETAFAVTVHKAQGSEFDEVLLMLPAEYNRVLTRELLYTAVTRARARVTIIGGADVLGKAIQSQTRRHSGLIARLHELGAPTRP